MGSPFLGEIRIIGFNYPPKGWSFCDGQLLAIQQNQALFSILGTTYGVNGVNTFALPDLRGRTPIYVGNGHVLGEKAGEENHAVSLSEMPAHNHLVSASSAAPNQGSPLNGEWASQTSSYSTAAANTVLNPSAIANAGGNQPHSNLQPYLVLNFVIALVGIFPSRN